jgi:hypothetical protein
MQIFGEQEKIYGYENLRIDVSLFVFLPIEYVLMLPCSCALLLALYGSIWQLSTLPNFLSTTIDNPEKQLYDFIPPGRLVGLDCCSEH